MHKFTRKSWKKLHSTEYLQCLIMSISHLKTYILNVALTSRRFVVDSIEEWSEIGGNECLTGGLLQGDANEWHKEAEWSLLPLIQVQLFHLLWETKMASMSHSENVLYFVLSHCNILKHTQQYNYLQLNIIWNAL